MHRMRPLLMPQAAFAAEAPVSDSKYDMVGQILAAAQAAPEHTPRDDPLRSLLDGLRRVVGLDAAPAGACQTIRSVGATLVGCAFTTVPLWQD